jgi:hypothetical protein
MQEIENCKELLNEEKQEILDRFIKKFAEPDDDFKNRKKN